MAKKKKTDDVKDLDEFALTAQLINKEMGDTVLRSLDHKVRNHGITGGLSSGSLWLDYVINAKEGGMRWGQLLQLYGKRSGGKSTLALGFCANCTQHKRHVLYLDLEGTMDADMVLRAGVDPDYFHFIDSDGSDAALIINRMMLTGNVGLVVIDSLAVWEPDLVAKKGSSPKDMIDFTKGKIAAQGSFITQAIRRLCKTAIETGTVLISINQVRSNLDPYSGELSLVPYGPHLLDHAVSVQCLVKGKPRGSKTITDQSGELIGQYVEITVDKNKTAVPMQQAEIPLIFGVGVNPFMELAVLAQRFGIVRMAGSWFKSIETDENLAQGMAGFTTKLATDPEFYNKLQDEVIKAMGLNYTIKPINAYTHPRLEGWAPELKLLKNIDE